MHEKKAETDKEQKRGKFKEKKTHTQNRGGGKRKRRRRNNEKESKGKSTRRKLAKNEGKGMKGGWRGKHIYKKNRTSDNSVLTKAITTSYIKIQVTIKKKESIRDQFGLTRRGRE